MPRRAASPLGPWTQTALRLRTTTGPPLYTVTLADATATGDTTVASCVVPAGTWIDGEIVVVRLLALLKNDSGSSRSTAIKAGATGASTATIHTNSLTAQASEFNVFGHIPFIRGGTTLYVPGRALTAGIAPNLTGSNLTSGARDLIVPAHTFDTEAVGQLVPSSFDADITLTILVNLATTHASYYFKPRHGAAYKVREFLI